MAESVETAAAPSQVRRRGLVGIWHGRTDRLASHHAMQPHPAHQALDGAASGWDRFSMQLAPDLAATVNAEVLIPDALDFSAQPAIALDSGRRAVRLGFTGLVLVVRRRGNRQDTADRLNPVRLPVIIDELDHHLPRPRRPARRTPPGQNTQTPSGGSRWPASTPGSRAPVP